jgi:tetratricopeptide (TPR) repeat protein
LYEASIAFHPDDLHAYADAATIHELLGEHQRASFLWRELAQRAPGLRGPSLHADRAEILSQMAIQEAPPEQTSARLSAVAESYLATGDIERAIDYQSQALKAGPNRAEVWLQMSRSLSEAGRYREAVAAIDRAIELAPGLSAATVMKEELNRMMRSDSNQGASD